MKEVLFFLNDFIRLDILFSFGYYSIIIFTIALFVKNKTFLIAFDQSAIQVMIYGGLFWGIIWLFSLILSFSQMENIENQISPIGQITKYWRAIFIQPILWIVLSQLFRIKFFQQVLFFRILISFLFVFTIEMYIITVSSIFAPSNNSPGLFEFLKEISIIDILAGLFSKLFFFIATVSIVHYSKHRNNFFNSTSEMSTNAEDHLVVK